MGNVVHIAISTTSPILIQSEVHTLFSEIERI